MKRILSQLVEIAIEMDSSPGGDVSTNDLIGVTQIGPSSCAENFYESQTTSSLANARFVTSTPVVARNLISSWVSVIILVRY
jgi:hypothetical protein